MFYQIISFAISEFYQRCQPYCWFFDFFSRVLPLALWKNTDIAKDYHWKNYLNLWDPMLLERFANNLYKTFSTFIITFIFCLWTWMKLIAMCSKFTYKPARILRIYFWGYWKFSETLLSKFSYLTAFLFFWSTASILLALVSALFHLYVYF